MIVPARHAGSISVSHSSKSKQRHTPAARLFRAAFFLFRGNHCAPNKRWAECQLLRADPKRLEGAEGKVAVDFVDGAVAVHVQSVARKCGGKFFPEAAGHHVLQLLLNGRWDGRQGGDARLSPLVGAILRNETE